MRTRSWLIGLTLFVAGCVTLPAQEKETPIQLGWETDLPTVLSRSSRQGRLAILFFCSDWAPPCRTMVDQVLKDTGIRRELRDFETGEINVDDQPSIAAQYRITALPTFVVLASDGTELDRFTGFLPRRVFVETLRAAADPSQSIAALRAKIEGDPAAVEPRWLLSKKLARDRNMTELMEQTAKIRELDPEGRRGYLDNAAYMEIMTSLNAQVAAEGMNSVEKFLEDFPDSEFADEMQMTRAQLAYQMNEKEKAAEILEKLRKDHPESDLSGQVTKDIEKIRQEIGR